MINDYESDNIFGNNEDYTFTDTKNDFDSDSNEDIFSNDSFASSQNIFTESNTDNTEPDIEEILKNDSFKPIPSRGINNIFHQNLGSYNPESNSLFDNEVLFQNTNNQQQMEVTDIDFSEVNANIIAEEQAYQNQEIINKARPVINQALYQQKNQMNEELHQVLNNSIADKLVDYENRSRKRKIKERISLFTKLGVAALIIALFIVNPQLRKRTTIVLNDFGTLIQGLVNGEDVNSNTLVDDLFKNLDEDFEDQDRQEHIDNQETKSH